MTSKVVTAIGAALVVFSVAASAQGLGDLAKQEEARRKTVATPGKVYTNDNLRTAPGPSTPPASTSTAASTTADKGKDSTSATDNAAADKGAPAAGGDKAAADKTAGKADVMDEAGWRKKMTDARNQLDRSQSFAEALQTRINSLTTDFTNRDDPAQRSQIAADRDKALAQLTQLKKEIDDNTKAIQNIQEDARKAGVPAGWVR